MWSWVLQECACVIWSINSPDWAAWWCVKGASWSPCHKWWKWGSLRHSQLLSGALRTDQQGFKSPVRPNTRALVTQGAQLHAHVCSQDFSFQPFFPAGCLQCRRCVVISLPYLFSFSPFPEVTAVQAIKATFIEMGRAVPQRLSVAFLTAFGCQSKIRRKWV